MSIINFLFRLAAITFEEHQLRWNINRRYQNSRAKKDYLIALKPRRNDIYQHLPQWNGIIVPSGWKVRMTSCLCRMRRSLWSSSKREEAVGDGKSTFGSRIIEWSYKTANSVHLMSFWSSSLTRRHQSMGPTIASFIFQLIQRPPWLRIRPRRDDQSNAPDSEMSSLNFDFIVFSWNHTDCWNYEYRTCFVMQ